LDQDLVRQIRSQIAQEELDQALLQIDAAWDDSNPLVSELADLKALAYLKRGDVRGALEVLKKFAAGGLGTFHTYYRLAEYHRLLGDFDQTYRNHRLAHAQLGWPESVSHGYLFTHDYFSPMIPFWQRRFSQHITIAPINALEIGSWQGGSATWLLDKVISRRGGRLTCIDTFEGSSEHIGLMANLGRSLEDIFDNNIRRTGHGDLIRKIVGPSQRVLPTLAGEDFDFIYIDGAHEAKYVIQDAVLCWGLLKQGGYMLFDDLNFPFHAHPEQNTSRATDFFLSVMVDDLEILEHTNQLLVRRTQ
jgi:predicted O-methyltransferase YrrM